MTLPVSPHFPILAGGIEAVSGTKIVDTGLRELQSFCASINTVGGAAPAGGVASWSLIVDTGPTRKVQLRYGVEKVLGVAATGSITTIVVANLVDGETFTISDGIHTAKVFEFDVNGTGVTPGNVRVDVSTLTTANEVRDVIIAVINGLSSFNITASSGGAATVSLGNDLAGTLGNVAITETVADVGFAVTGMSGGVNEVIDDTVGKISWIALGK